MAKKEVPDPKKATLSAKDKAKQASNGKQSKADLEKDVGDALATLGMEETGSRHGMKTFRQKGKK
jgi:hypothetical protein